MLITGKEMLDIAMKNKFAVAAFNAGSGQLLPAVIEAAEETGAPFMMAIHPDELSFLGDSYIAQVHAAIQATKIPVVLHLDHGASYEQVIHAIQLGFTSVMFDGSHLSFEENIRITQKVVEAAHAVGVSVEAELGTIGDTGNSIEGGATEIIFTDPENAKEFVERTGVDSLAIAIGTSHGIYPKNYEPHLRFDILEEITKRVDIPLVLHGGSSNPDDEIAKSVAMGIAKINISSDIKIVFADKLREILNNSKNEIREPNVMFPECMEETKKVAIQKINLFKSNNKASLYK
ncbi:ketose-bisphosphate aldolase [Erysipelothrix sp. HDW6C]|uniref:ketose-bisphosphate aldolase n=1 Tax=Erysipelothrix sp. HDW6C TaxID=2714930 RepID=UPI00140E1440|nr:ketose-bisphosphate aldolase [Erysipelothrix sp. HDW6C]QIK70667.1 ketose-bisphosphate aldolase [Erysipelothrix sp. HDW6C]